MAIKIAATEYRCDRCIERNRAYRLVPWVIRFGVLLDLAHRPGNRVSVILEGLVRNTDQLDLSLAGVVAGGEAVDCSVVAITVGTAVVYYTNNGCRNCVLLTASLSVDNAENVFLLLSRNADAVQSLSDTAVRADEGFVIRP